MQATLLPEPVCERARADSLLLAAVTRRLFQRLLPPLWLTFFACYISRNNIAFAGPDGMDGDLHLSKADYGLASGLFFAGYAILRFVLELIRVDESGQFGTSLSISLQVRLLCGTHGSPTSLS